MPFDYFSLGKHVTRRVVFSSLNVAVCCFRNDVKTWADPRAGSALSGYLVFGVWWERGEGRKRDAGSVMEPGARILELDCLNLQPGSSTCLLCGLGQSTRHLGCCGFLICKTEIRIMLNS